MKSKNKYGLVLPLIIWLMVFLLLPYFFILIQSFLQTDSFGMVVYKFNLDSYKEIFSNSLYYGTLFRTFGFALVVAISCICLSIPLAYFIAFKVKKYKTFLYTLIVLPFWISYIVRAYAWKIILGEQGILNTFLIRIHITNHPLDFLLYSNFSTIICLIHIFTPFVAIPIYTAFEQIPKSLVEASKDLGAGSFTTLRRIIFPLALPGIISGGTFALVLTMGDFLSPLLLGGPNTLFISNIVQNLFGTSNDKPLGSAVGIVVLGLIFILLEISTKLEKKYSSLKSESR
jgi:spermidine/putrescine transport system permease protein